MAASYYPITADKFFGAPQSAKSITATSYYPPYEVTKKAKQHYDEDDDDLDALRNAALQTLKYKKCKYDHDRSPTRHHSRSPRQSLSRSSSRSYSLSSISSDEESSPTSSYTSSSSSSTTDSRASHSHDKDYRFEESTNQEKPVEKNVNTDIDDRFPRDTLGDDDMLIVSCPIQDDDLLLQIEHPQQITSIPSTSAPPVNGHASATSPKKPPLKDSDRRKERPHRSNRDERYRTANEPSSRGTSSNHHQHRPLPKVDERRTKKRDSPVRSSSSRRQEKRNSPPPKQSSPIPPADRPIPVTVHIGPDNFDLRQLIKRRRPIDESKSASLTNTDLSQDTKPNDRLVQILPKENESNVHKSIHHRLSQTNQSRTSSQHRRP